MTGGGGAKPSSTLMSELPSKFRCLFLPAQSGKTRKVEEEIKEFKKLCNIEDVLSIDIFISANNRLLVHQTTKRLKTDLSDASPAEEDDDDTMSIASSEDDVESDAVIEGEIFSWTSGTKIKIGSEHLALKIVAEEVEMVIMCANKRRFDYLEEMLSILTNQKLFRRNPRRINIWIDEADSSMNIWRKFGKMFDNPAIDRVTLVSATFGSVLKVFKTLRVMPYEYTHPECYRRLKDCNTVVVEPASKDPVEYVDQILTANPALSTPGMCGFIPGNVSKDSHHAITEYLYAKNFAVILINGERKELLIPGETLIVDLRPYLSCADSIPPEFNKTLSELYVKHNLSRFPLAITGYLCVQRGVTFQCAPAEDSSHNGFVFHYGIIQSTSKKAEAYQTMARIFGNTGGFANYVKATIFADSRTFAGVKDQEETAVHLPRIVFDDKLEIVTEIDFMRAAAHDNPEPFVPPVIHPKKVKDPSDRAMRVFDSQDDAIKFASTTLNHKFHKRKTDTAPEEVRKEFGGSNPTAEYLLSRLWGINAKTPVRMCPTNDGKWCVYWKPSLFPVGGAGM